MIQAAACIKFSIIGYIITTPRFLGCNGGYFDYCDPPWWEIHSCQNSGGYWDYGYCACNWGYWY